MEKITLIFCIAIITEALIEYGKTIGSALIGNDKKTAVIQLVAIVLSVILCFAANVDLFEVVGITFSFPWIGIVLTGVLGSRGANYLSDFITKLNRKKE